MAIERPSIRVEINKREIVGEFGGTGFTFYDSSSDIAVMDKQSQPVQVFICTNFTNKFDRDVRVIEITGLIPQTLNVEGQKVTVTAV